MIRPPPRSPLFPSTPLSRPRAFYSPPFARFLPLRSARVTRARLERCWARHPNRSNPYAWRFFLGMDPPDYNAPTLPSPASGGGEDVPLPEGGGGKVDLVCADAAAYLEGCPRASFVGVSLSDILDGTQPAHGGRPEA